MSDNYRYRRGAPNAIVVSPDSTVLYEQGDLLFLDADDNLRNSGSSTATEKPVPFSEMDAGTSQADDEQKCSDRFFGVCMSHSAVGDTLDILVYRSGEFVFPLDSAATVELGDQVEVHSTGAGAVSDQIVTPGTTDPLGRVVKRGTSVSEANIEIMTAYLQGGVIS